MSWAEAIFPVMTAKVQVRAMIIRRDHFRPIPGKNLAWLKVGNRFLMRGCLRLANLLRRLTETMSRTPNTKVVIAPMLGNVIKILRFVTKVYVYK